MRFGERRNPMPPWPEQQVSSRSTTGSSGNASLKRAFLPTKVAKVFIDKIKATFLYQLDLIAFL
jgi:hypothetical protein